MSAWWAILSNWWGGISLRVKLIASLVVSAFSVVTYLYVRWRTASAMGQRASERADKLQRARDAEIRILKRQADARKQRDKLREHIRERKERDFFEDPYR